MTFNISEKLNCPNRVDNSAFEVFRSQREIMKGERGIYNEGLLPYTLLYLKEELKGISDKMFYHDRI